MQQVVDNKKYIISAVAIFLNLTLFTIVYGQNPCPPGDIALDANGNVVTEPGANLGKVASCLYGGDVATNRGFGPTITDPRSNIRIALNIIMGFLAIIVLAMILYGGALWLTAMGSEEKVERGKNTLLWAATGAIVISIAWTVTSYILSVGGTIAG
jgi:hypothetical protein